MDSSPVPTTSVAKSISYDFLKDNFQNLALYAAFLFLLLKKLFTQYKPTNDQKDKSKEKSFGRTMSSLVDYLVLILLAVFIIHFIYHKKYLPCAPETSVLEKMFKV
jgi:hypothetical protein